MNKVTVDYNRLKKVLLMLGLEPEIDPCSVCPVLQDCLDGKNDSDCYKLLYEYLTKKGE